MVSKELNKLFENATKAYIIDTDSNDINSVEKAINEYRNHPRVIQIKGRLKNIPNFSFNEASLSKKELVLN